MGVKRVEERGDWRHGVRPVILELEFLYERMASKPTRANRTNHSRRATIKLIYNVAWPPAHPRKVC